MNQLPSNLSSCDPHAPVFPKEWKQSFFRRHFDNSNEGYICPDCQRVFSGPSGFSQLHADHIIPRAKGGLTIWSNLVLRCGPCNLAKSDKLI